ncbi:melatonin receptor type 1A-like [Diadema antillarum]|uniref:melatonin receptor type 1A-like n=1 Tax=Diadema antillarum TaxID=105358 RepID=UPI003A8B2404
MALPSGQNASGVPEESSDGPSTSEILETVFLALVCVVGTVGNLLVILAIGTTRALQVRHNIFMVHLAVVDLITAAVLAPFFMFSLVNGGWPLDDKACLAIGYLTTICLTISGMTVNGIAVCRAVTVIYTNPVERSRKLTRVILMISVVLVALVAVVVTLPTAFGIGAVGYNEHLGHCSVKYTNTSEWYYCAILFLIGLVTTLTVVPVSYGLIFMAFHKSRMTVENMSLASRTNPDSKARRSDKRVGPPKQLSDRKLLSRDEIRLTRNLLLLYGVFLLCWIPYTSVLLADRNLTKTYAVHRATNIFLWLNSCLNPLLYALMIRSFRQAYKRMLCKVFCGKGTSCIK